MGRPRKEHPMTATERSRKWRSDPDKRLEANRRKREARQLKAHTNTPSEEELMKKREADRMRKALSRLNQSRQKKVGTKLKDRNRKRKEVRADTGETSTQRVQKHRAMKVKLDFRSKKQNVDHVAKVLDTSLSMLSPQSKVKAVAQSCNNILSQASKSSLSECLVEGQSNPLVDFHKRVANKRDKITNCARRLVLNTLAEKAGSVKKAKRTNRNLNWRSLQQAVQKDLDEIIVHYKTTKKTAPRPSTETVEKVKDFYNRDNISRQLPYKNLTRKIKDCLGVYHRVPIRVMEVTLKKAYDTFKAEYPEVKISRRAFEIQRPKNIRLRRYAQRLQCCCTYHTNMDYIRKACNTMFINNGKPTPFPNSDALISFALCEPNSIKCIFRVCATCKTFPKIDELAITSLKCSKSCMKENINCTEHTVKVKQFERITYMHKGSEKKKLKLVDKMLTPIELVLLLKEKLNKFPMHRFNVQQTAKTYEKIISNLDEHSILKIHDFSENYTCLLPEEIQSLHWTQETATVYPIVVLRRVGEDIREDHLTFISDDKNHDVPFVEHCNDILHKYYEDEGLSITHDIEYNDGCASQFKCVRAFSSLAKRHIKTTRVFCETSHGKSKSDGLGGVIKSYASRAVCGERRVIRDAKELFTFFDETLVVKAAYESNKPMLNRRFFYVSAEDMDNYRSELPSDKYIHIPGTLAIHEVVSIPGNTNTIMYRNSSCGCTFCLNNEYEKCESLEQFKEYPKNIMMTTHSFSVSTKKQKQANNEKHLIDLDEEEAIEWDEMYMETEASRYIQEGDFAIIKTGDDHAYYLLKLTSPPYETESEVTDDYKHSFPPFHRVVEGNYLEIYKEITDGNLYYIDTKRKALISAFCVVGNCPTPPTMTVKKRGKDVEMFLVDHDLHQALSELVNIE